MFISLEGIDGCGKSTVLTRLSQLMTHHNINHICTREPGGSPLGEKVRTILLNNNITPDVQLLLFFAARLDHINKVIEPALSDRTVVLCDRYVDSTLVYQGHCQGLDVQRLLPYVKVLPTITFYLKISGETAAKRRELSGKQDSGDIREPSFWDQAIEGYDKLALNSDRVVVVDAELSIDHVVSVIWAHLVDDLDWLHDIP